MTLVAARSLAPFVLVAGACRSESRAPVTDVVPPQGAVTTASAPLAAPSAAPSPAMGATSVPESEARPWPPAASGATSDFCIDGVSALDVASCYVLPDAPASELLVYLHGIVPPAKTSLQKTNFETVVSQASRRAGVAALMPRGRQGLAPKGHDGWWGWPTSVETYRTHASELIAEIAAKRQKLETLTGAPFTRVYLAGSSSGAYFVVALAVSGDFRADGFTAISGGALRPGHDFAKLRPTPFYVGYGTRDTVAESARALAAGLRGGGWPVVLAAHPLEHGAAEVYLDEAFAFFRSR